MGANGCRRCGPGSPLRGSGRIADPRYERTWWEKLLGFSLRTIPCPDCGGDGYAKPPGWPDPEAMRRQRPISPPPPPKGKVRSTAEMTNAEAVADYRRRLLAWLIQRHHARHGTDRLTTRALVGFEIEQGFPK